MTSSHFPEAAKGHSDSRVGNAALTSPTLLSRVRADPADEAAWSEFVDRYAPHIYAWCRAWRLQETDAQDVTQAVLVKLVRQMRRFDYDPDRSFRGWLRTLVENAIRDWIADRRNREVGSGETKVLQLLGFRPAWPPQRGRRTGSRPSRGSQRPKPPADSGCGSPPP